MTKVPQLIMVSNENLQTNVLGIILLIVTVRVLSVTVLSRFFLGIELLHDDFSPEIPAASGRQA